MAIVNPVSYLQNRTDHTAQTDRLGLNALLQGGPSISPPSWRQGVLGVNDYKAVAQGTPNMTVAVGGGQAYVNQAAANGGAYAVTNDASVNVTITAAHASLPRRDLIILRVEDSFYTGAVNQGSLQVITGTAAASPTDPAVTGNYLLLARVTLPAAATSVTNAYITDIRPRTGAVGGCLYLATTAERDALTNIGPGQLVYVAQTDTYFGRSAANTWMTLPSEQYFPVSGNTVGSAGGTTIGAPPADAVIMRQIGYVSATTSAIGLVTVTFPTPFPNGILHVTAMTVGGTAGTPVVNGGLISKTSVQLIWANPTLASTNVKFSYEAVGW